MRQRFVDTLFTLTCLPSENTYVSRGGEKLAAALDHFGLDVAGRVCADLGCHVGGFTDCLLRRGATRVYTVDTAYGSLAWRLRRDPRVVVLERTNAVHVTLPERVGLVTIDVGWTPQRRILPGAARMLATGGRVVTLVKPQYEAPADLLDGGVLPDDHTDSVLSALTGELAAHDWTVLDRIDSPIRGHGGNREVFLLLARV